MAFIFSFFIDICAKNDDANGSLLVQKKKEDKSSDLPQKVDINWNLINKDKKLNNDITAIYCLCSQIDVSKLKDTVVAVPCVNIWDFLKFQQKFADERDLNRQFPGKEDRFSSQNKIISQFNYIFDLHTSSFGRVNSYYVRADMNDPLGAKMAKLQQPQILLHNSGQDGMLQSAAAARGIKAITVKIGNSQAFQGCYIQIKYSGLLEVKKGEVIDKSGFNPQLIRYRACSKVGTPGTPAKVSVNTQKGPLKKTDAAKIEKRVSSRVKFEKNGLDTRNNQPKPSKKGTTACHIDKCMESAVNILDKHPKKGGLIHVRGYKALLMQPCPPFLNSIEDCWSKIKQKSMKPLEKRRQAHASYS
ncbi:hypothetical protein INT46_010581 [Mucor plumbeus]|uniref:Succinylglutamate desuccinylase/Aspartoacylase catalytic domain-containing protein n=1 Tax=Mucor plumbeus TaxID=97098 RepID=A0A8H7QLE7_9FUNG|nr:hypothetical protein INT46_010581 [Mucor plumbeus]